MIPGDHRLNRRGIADNASLFFAQLVGFIPTSSRQVRSADPRRGRDAATFLARRTLRDLRHAFEIRDRSEPLSRHVAELGGDRIETWTSSLMTCARRSPHSRFTSHETAPLSPGHMAFTASFVTRGSLVETL